MIHLKYIGCNFKENKNFIIDRPKGSNDFLFLLFHTDIYIVLNQEKHFIKGGCAVLYSPDCPQYYHNPVSGFENDWIHFDGKKYEELIASLNFPLNQPIHLTNISFVHNRILDIERENLMKDIGSSLMIDHKITDLIIELSREYNRQSAHKYNPYYYELELQFRDIRANMLSSISKQWTIDELASLVGLSRSRFSYLYKAFFTISPKEDLLYERFKMAKHLLSTQTQPISSIAITVGYENIYTFSKQFKKITKLSPTEFRNQYSLLFKPQKTLPL